MTSSILKPCLRGLVVVSTAVCLLSLGACGSAKNAAADDVASVDDSGADASLTDVAGTDALGADAAGTDAVTADLAPPLDAAADAPDTAPDVAVDAPDVATTCTCGDQNCNAACGETLATCPYDCATCPDGICSPGESPKTCSQDCCGSCGDGKCIGYECGENPTTCPQDCLSPCGNGICEKGENPGNCAADCKKQVCGNGVCEPEDGGPALCPQDCASTCGDCKCDKGEDFNLCPVDCGYCGDGVCSNCAGQNESAATCVADCKGDGCKGGCDDSNPCTIDLCGSAATCIHVPDVAKACDDGDPCTSGDQCLGGSCKGSGSCADVMGDVADVSDAGVVDGVAADTMGDGTGSEVQPQVPIIQLQTAQLIFANPKASAPQQKCLSFGNDGGAPLIVTAAATISPANPQYAITQQPQVGDQIAPLGSLDNPAAAKAMLQVCVTMTPDADPTNDQASVLIHTNDPLVPEAIVQVSAQYATASSFNVACGSNPTLIAYDFQGAATVMVRKCVVYNQGPTPFAWVNSPQIVAIAPSTQQAVDAAYALTLQKNGKELAKPYTAGSLAVGTSVSYTVTFTPPTNGKPWPAAEVVIPYSQDSNVGSLEVPVLGTGQPVLLSGSSQLWLHATVGQTALGHVAFANQGLGAIDVLKACVNSGSASPPGSDPCSNSQYASKYAGVLLPVGASKIAPSSPGGGNGLLGVDIEFHPPNDNKLNVNDVLNIVYCTEGAVGDGTCVTGYWTLSLTGNTDASVVMPAAILLATPATPTIGLPVFVTGTLTPGSYPSGQSWSWSLIDRPAGSLAWIGEINQSTSDPAISFVPDRPGKYVLEASALTVATGGASMAWTAPASVSILVACNSEADCDDGSPCTVDGCDANGSCVFGPIVCPNGAACVEATGTCQCGSGYVGNGASCTVNLACPATDTGCSCPDGFLAIAVDSTSVCAPDYPAWGNRGDSPGPSWFINNSDGTISDSNSQLQWQAADTCSAVNWSGGNGCCQALTLGGHSDWRLPTLAELQTLIDYTVTAPTVAAMFKATTTADFYWAASPYLDSSVSSAWITDFSTGKSKGDWTYSDDRVRCVRSAVPWPALSSRFAVDAAGTTVYDIATKLTWQRAVPATGGYDGNGGYSWANAKAYCTNLSLAGGGWRLPWVGELQGIVDRRETSPAIDPAAFPGTPATPVDYFWSASPVQGSSSLAWNLFYNGRSMQDDVSLIHHVRCVR